MYLYFQWIPSCWTHFACIPLCHNPGPHTESEMGRVHLSLAASRMNNGTIQDCKILVEKQPLKTFWFLSPLVDLPSLEQHLRWWPKHTRSQSPLSESRIVFQKCFLRSPNRRSHVCWLIHSNLQHLKESHQISLFYPGIVCVTLTLYYAIRIVHLQLSYPSLWGVPYREKAVRAVGSWEGG